MNTVTKMVLPDGTTQYYDYNYWGQIEEQGYLDSDNQKYGIVTSTYNTIGELDDGDVPVFAHLLLNLR